MNWSNIDFPRKITDTIKIESMTTEGSFVVKYLGPGGDYKKLAWHPVKSEEKFDVFTSKVLNAVKKKLGF
jgi:hypothetical protein